MKILHIINSLATGGAEKLLLETLPLYRQRGMTVDLMVLDGNSYPFLEELQGLDCCNIISLDANSVYDPTLTFKIIPHLSHYDIAHVHLFPAQYWVVLAKIISFSKIQLLFTEHSTSNKRLRGNFFVRTTDRLFYRPYKYIIAITEEVSAVMQNHTKITSDKFRIIKNGVNLKKIKESEALPKSSFFSEEDKVLLQVSSFQEPKDQRTVLRALSLLPAEYKLILVGDGILKRECELLATELGVLNRVLFLGIRRDVLQLLKTADIVVLSSKYEGLSLSSIEGMASGKPFVASAVPGLNEVVTGGGILFKCGDYKQLAEEILHLMSDAVYYSKTVENCLKQAEKYDISAMVNEHIALYRSL